MKGFQNVTVEVDGSTYGGQYVTHGDEVVVFYGGAMCGRQPCSPDVTAHSIARAAIRAEVRRRMVEALKPGLGISSIRSQRSESNVGRQEP